MTTPIGKTQIREVTISKTKTVAELLHELNISIDHVVLVEGVRQPLDAVLDENSIVIVLPIIAGG